MGASMEMTGLDSLLQQLRNRSETLSRSEGNILRAGAAVVREAMSRRAPRSSMIKRHMADYIVVTKIQQRDGIKFVRVGPSPGDNHEFYYAKFLEYGTSKMAAQPFAAPAAAESMKPALEAMKQRAAKELGL